MPKQSRAFLLGLGGSITVCLALVLLFWPGAARGLLSTTGFQPHGYCFVWEPRLMWLFVTSDLLIGSSYVAISLTLAYLVHRARSDIPFGWIVIAFGLFIIACGGTHYLDVVTLYEPLYWLAGNVRVVTAIASVTTAVLLPPLVPKTLRLIASAKLSEERKQSLQVANAELEQLYAQSQELDRLKTEFFANVSHELRTPLALILGPIEQLVADETLSATQRHNVLLMQQNAEALLNQVNDLLDVTKLEAGGMPVQYAEVELSDLVQHTADQFESLATETGIVLTVDAPPVVAQLDPALIERVIRNLVANALKFTPAGGWVRLAVGATETEVALVVEDSGPGIPLELRSVIFERFRQGDGGTTRRFGGTGIGLAIVAEAVRLHGGIVTIDSSAVGGARFVVQLPRFAPAGASVQSFGRQLEQIAPRAAIKLEPSSSDTDAGNADRPLVLVVEDNPGLNRFICDALRPLYRVVSAVDGGEGLTLARTAQPDLILSDIMMPVLGGDQLITALRAERAFDRVPIVLLSAKADDRLRVQMLEQGAQDYMIKPFGVAELRARLHNLLVIKQARDVLQQTVALQSEDVAHLARELAAQQTALQEANDVLEERVAQRTQELQAANIQLGIELEQRRHAETVLEAHAIQLQQSNRELQEFAAVASHDLQEPLRKIQAFGDRLRQQEGTTLSATSQDYLARMLQAAERMQTLIHDLLTLARVTTIQQPLREVDLAQVVTEVLADLETRIEDVGGIVEIGSLAVVQGDPLQLRQLVQNLLSNGLKFHRAEVPPVVRVSGRRLASSQDGIWFELRVEDNGIGFEERFLDRIFAPFQRLHGRTSYEGTGIGLAICRRIVERHGGTITAHSIVGVGTTFVVTLPMGQATEEVRT